MKENEKSEVLTKILEDRTPDKDAFGGHERVAKAIYELIEDEKEGGKAIALSGGFGSGKSTVIDFLKRKFQENKKKDKTDTQIFVFDAWEHQGNPLRRAFLEKYINFLRDDEVKWASKKEWEEELELVTKNREEIETTSEPKITTLGGWFALSLLLLPLGLASVRLGIVDPSVMWLIYTGFILLLLPTIILIGIYVCWRPFRPKHWAELKEEYKLEDFKFWDKSLFKHIGYFLYHHRPDHHKKSIFNFVIKKSTEDVETTSLKSPDPTTIEFQKLFGKITKRVLSDKNRRIIIVVDNIDRLTTESSINAWTTLQTFFKNDDKNLEWNKQFWMIAPFDLQELKNLWGGLDHLTNSESSGTSDKTSDYVKAFLDKTFQVLFRVPQPVLSDWKEYFIKQMAIAFPKLKDQKIFNNVATLYQLKGIKDGNSPTPREIKQFINRLGAQYRIWHGEINLPALAYYELVAVAEHQVIVKKLQKNELVDPTFKSVIGENKLNSKLAAIHFNCEITKANQVLFGDEVTSALQEGSAENLKDYFETEGFKDVLNSEFYSFIGTATAESLANCALCLIEIEDKIDIELNDYFHQLSSSLLDITSFKPFNKRIGKGIVKIWQKEGFSDQWISSMLVNLSAVELDEEDNSIEDWYSLIQPIFEKLSEKGVEQLLVDNFSIPGGANDYIKVLTYLNKLDEKEKTNLAKYIQPILEPDHIVNAYSSFLKSDELPDDLGGALYLQSFSKEIIEASDWNWEDLVNQIKAKIQVNVNTEADKIEASLKMLLILCYKFEINSAIQLSNDKNFQNGLFYLITTQNESLWGLLILNSILFNPNNQKTINDNKVNKGHTTLNNILSDPSGKKFINDNFLNVLIEYQLIDKFFNAQHGNSELKSLSNIIIENFIESDKALELLDSNIVFKYFDDIYQAVEEKSLSDHIEELYNQDENITDRLTTEYDTVPSNFIMHYFFAKCCPDELREKYFEYLAEGFRNLEKDDWLKHLTEETELIHLLILVQEEGIELELSIPLREALFDHFKQIYSGKLELPNLELLSKWSTILSSLKNEVKITLLHNMKDHIESDSSAEGSVSSVGEIYDSIFLEYKVFLDSPDRFVRTVFSRVLKSADLNELKWLKDIISNEPDIINEAGDAGESFREEIKDIDVSDNPETKNIINEVAHTLGIDRNQDKIED